MSTSADPTRTGLAAPILLYDGDCAFCAKSVRFLLEHDHRARAPGLQARFAAREGIAGRGVLARHPAAAAVDSLVWVDVRIGRETALVKYRAVLAICGYLGGGWALLGTLGRLVPRPLGDAAYDLVARHRQRLAGGAEACVMFTPEERTRVLE